MPYPETPLPEARVTVRQMGREGEPLVIIDGFSGKVEELREAGYAATYRDPGAAYPGVRSWAEPNYLDLRRPLMMQIMQRVFGLTRGVRMDVSTFSLVTVPEAELSPAQRLPHYDHASDRIIGVMHYLLGPESGGTAFYRHQRTGFEAITAEREEAYFAALEADDREYGIAPPRYYHGDSARFALIDEVQAQPDRMIIYRGRQLHSGVIPDQAALSSDPRRGRLTINMFIEGL
mgnify:CR=1 FL=1